MLYKENLHWIQNGRHPVYEYQMLDGEKVVQKMTFDYRKSTYTAYCETENGHFVIDREGFFKTKLVLKENDQVIGRFYPKNWYSNSGIAEIDGEKIEYRIVNNPLAEIRFLYHDNLLISCGIKHQNGKTRVSIATAMHFDRHPLAKYLLAVSWYLLLPSTMEDDGMVLVV
jgi:hypothetical protein